MTSPIRFVTRTSSVRRRSAAAALVAASAAALSAVHAGAANYLWDPGQTASGGGSGGAGTWDTVTSQWYLPGTGDTAWPNTMANVAEFNGTAGTVALGTAITTGGLKFDVAGYTLNTGANTLTVNSTIAAANASGAVTTVAGTVAFSANQTWTAPAGTTLNVNAQLANFTAATYYGLITTGGGTTNISGGTAAAPSNVNGVFVAGAGTTNISGVFNTSSSNANNTKFDINNGGVVNWSATGTQAGSYDGMGDGSNGTLNVNAGTLTFAPTLGTFVSTGAGVAGTLNISGGTLVIASNANIYVGDSYNGTSGGGTGVGTVNVNSGTLTTGTTTGSFIFGGATGGGTGTLNLSGGTLASGRSITAGSAGKGTVNFNGGTLQATGTGLSLGATMTGNVLAGGAIVDTNGFAAAIASNLASGGPGDGGLTKLGVGVLTVSGTNTYVGSTNVSAGVLAATTPAALPGYATAGQVSVANGAYLSFGYNGSGSTFTPANIATAQAAVAFAPGSGLGLDVASGTTANYSGGLGGFTNFIKTGGGTLTLSGTNTYTGSTTVANGLLAEPSVSALGSISTLTLGYGALTGGYSSIGIGETITLPIVLGGTTGGGTLDASASGPVVVSSTITVANVGAKTLTLQGSNTSSNTLASTLGNGAGTLALTKAGTGTWVVTSSNTYTGQTTIAGGILTAAASNALGINTISVNGGGNITSTPSTTLQLTGGITLPNAVNVSARNDPTATPTSAPQVENVLGNNAIGGNLTVVNSGGSGFDIQLDAGTVTFAGNLSNTTASTFARPFYFYGAGNAAVTGNVLAGSGAPATNASAIVKYGTGTLTLSGTGNTFTGGTSVLGGTVVAASNTAVGTGPVVVAAGATLSVASGNTPGGRTVLAVSSLNLSGGAGRLDVGGNDVDLPGASLAATTALAAQGFAGATWNGSAGIVSSVAAADAAHLTGVGVIQNNGLYGNGTTAPLLDRAAVDTGDVLVKLTYYGDANLDGVVNAADYTQVDAGFVLGLTGWANGDFNYDGVVDGSDYTLMDNAFNRQPTALASAIVATPAAAVAAVPEPTAVVAVAIIGATAAVGRRRRRV